MIFSNARNRSRHWKASMILLAVAIAPCLGCGSQHDLLPVKGVVHLEGAAVTSGKVLLTPLDTGKPSAGMIQPDGSFVLSTYHENDGVKPGRHRLTIVGDAHSEDQRARITWMAPKDDVIEIEADKENNLMIDINPAQGWKILADD